jgi:hypothetical protein
MQYNKTEHRLVTHLCLQQHLACGVKHLTRPALLAPSSHSLPTRPTLAPSPAPLVVHIRTRSGGTPVSPAASRVWCQTPPLRLSSPLPHPLLATPFLPHLPFVHALPVHHPPVSPAASRVWCQTPHPPCPFRAASQPAAQWGPCHKGGPRQSTAMCKNNVCVCVGGGQKGVGRCSCLQGSVVC